MASIQLITIVTAIVGMVTGVSSLVLGIVNRRDQIKYSTPKLRVIPQLAFPGPLDEMINETYFDERVQDALERLKTYACVAVTNIGPNPQTIHEVGFIDSRGIRIPWRDPEYVNPEQSYPIIIEPDKTVSVYIRIWPRDMNQIHGIAYAKTDCGDEFTGTSPIITDSLTYAKAINRNMA